MDLRQLEYVVAIADTGTFTAAASRAHASQPSVSHGVRALEAELGIDVFFRLGRSVAPTPAGEAVIAAARQALRDVETLQAAAAAAAGLREGRVDLVTLPTLAADPLAPILGRFRRERPGVQVRVTEPEGDGALHDEVASGRAELGMADLGGGAGAGLVRVPLFEQELLLVAPPGVSLAARVAPGALARQTFVATPPGTSSRRLLDEVVPDAVVAVEIAHRDAMLPLVLAGAGAALLPAPLAADAARRGAAVAALRPRVTRQIGLVHRPGPLSPAATALAALAVEALRS